jgi:elongation factor 1-beta
MSKLIKNPQTEEGLNELNELLLDQSFVMGHSTPSQPDLLVLRVIKDKDVSALAGIKRWKKFITSFSETETKSWPNLYLTIDGYVEPKEEVIEEEDDLFGEETEEEKKAKEEKKKADKENKKKEGPIGKSSILIDIKPWDDETSIDDMESAVRSIDKEGLTWQASKHVEVAYGIKKLQILCNIIDDKISSDDLEEAILGLSSLVQSMDIVSWNKSG